jgi:predicted transcriptional regulator
MVADSAIRGETPNPDSHLTFVSYDLMHKVLAPNRIAIVRAMTGQGPMSIREAARRVGRDFKGVHSDVTVLLRNGVLEKMDDGLIVFPYAKIHFDFEFGAANQSAA